MRIDSRTGRVKHTDVFCSRIESQKRGIYDDIWNSYTRREYHTPGNPETHTLRLAFMLHDTLEKRRKKEGKILFKTEEIQWNPEDKGHTFSPSLRTRNTAHTLIEECMILANEEIAKWCTKRNIPFLSRIHDAPSPEESAHIQSIIQHPHPHIHPKDIRDYLDQIQDPGALYRATRLLLPKMTKATYSEKRCPHF